MRKRLGLDLDGTICNTAGAMLKRLIAEGKIKSSITLNDVKWHNMEYDPIAKTGFTGLTQDDTKDLFMDPKFWGEIDIFNGVQPVIKKLHKEYEIHIVTARYWYDGIYDATVEWFNKNNVPFDQIHCMKSKNKWRYVKDNHLNWFVEDYAYPANLIAPYVETVFMINRPWNINDELADNCIRADWSEVGKVLLNRKGEFVNC